jgi:hypothetical protein
MRHITWAVTWMLVGLAVTLATASVIEQKASIRVASQKPATIAVPDPTPVDNAKPRTNEPTRSLVVAARHRRDLAN